MVYKHAFLNKHVLLLLHSAFMLCVVKMPLKGEVRSYVMEITSLIMENHGKIMELCFWISVEPC